MFTVAIVIVLRQVGYKVNSGAITYIAQDATSAGDGTNNGTLVTAEATVTASASNTITMYMKNTNTVNTTMHAMRVVAIEMAN